MRLFIAIRFSEAFKDALDSIARDIKRHSSGGSFTRKENYHLTLAFIGETDRCRDIKKIINTVDFPKFDISLSGSGHFGDIQWVGISGSEPLRALAADISKKLTDGGIEFDKKPFKPHITTARKCIPDRGFEPVVPDISMTCEAVSLMDSRRINGVLTYTEIFRKNSDNKTKAVT